MHEGFTWLDTTVLVLYLLGVLLAGLYFSKKEMKGKEFFKGDGTIPGGLPVFRFSPRS